MLTSSCKAKGRRAAAEVRELMLEASGDYLEPGDIGVTPSGVTGPDLMLSPKAKAVYSMAIEVKNQESIQIWAALAQAEKHDSDHPPVLFFRRNRSRLYAALPADVLIAVWTEAFLRGREEANGQVGGRAIGDEVSGKGDGE